MDFHKAPLLVYWELTQACELACRHCRADAIPERSPAELQTPEALALLDQLATFRQPLPHIVFTGGDPLKRKDLFRLIGRAKELGFVTAITPSGTYALTPSVIRKLKEAGIWMIGLSLDGSTAQRHDAVRGIEGTFERTLEAAEYAGVNGVPMQINTLVTEETADDLPAVHDLVVKMGAKRWSLFFLIQVGRGAALTPVTPGRGEKIMRWLAEKESPLDIKTTEAPSYRRVKSKLTGEEPRGVGVRDGCGVMFISHIGEIFPSGFLPLTAGNVRKDDPVRVYQESHLFRDLRHPIKFKGRCGECEFSMVCGGSRARAYAATGDPLESDPLCPYHPGK